MELNTLQVEEETRPVQVTFVSIKRCPVCGRKLCERLTACTGTISMKCPKCGIVSEINMACRHAFRM